MRQRTGQPTIGVIAAFAAGVTGLAGLTGLAACSGTPGTGTATSASPAGSATSSNSPGAGTSPTQPQPKGMGKGPQGTGLQRFYDQQVGWVPCPQSKGFLCGKVWVPLDYADPDGPAITLVAAKLPAARAATASGLPARRGTLVINPGGPGASGLEMLATGKFSPNLRATYDILGFDPRGVGASTPIDCLSDVELDAWLQLDPSPDDDAEIRSYQDAMKAFTAGCQAKSGRLLEHVSTVEAAKDLDILRDVAGEATLNYLGISYGTYLGATYAGLFPDKVDRMVLDGAVDPNAPAPEFFGKQTAGFELALTSYLTACVKSGKCPFGTSVEAARATVAKLLHGTDATPLPAAKGRRVTEGIAHSAIIAPLYAKAMWPMETQVLAALAAGKGDAVMAINDAFNKRLPNGTYALNQVEANAAVNCLDHPDDASVDDLLAARGESEKAAPVFGGPTSWSRYLCSNWPVKATTEKRDYAANGAAPIVVVGTTRDPATPYEGAKKLAETLASGVLLTYDGDGHGAFTAGNPCVTTALEGFLVGGKVPVDGTTCKG